MGRGGGGGQRDVVGTQEERRRGVYAFAWTHCLQAGLL